MWNWWNWLMVRPERMVLTVGAVVVILGMAAGLHEMIKSPFTTPPRLAYSEPYGGEVHEAWQANCERLRQPGRLC